MSNHARNLIVAVQNSLLGALFIRLVQPLLFLGMATSLAHDETTGAALWVIPALAAGVFVTWLIGHIANRHPPVQSPLHRLQVPPANGFDAWATLPEDDLRPSGAVRTLVSAIGRSTGVPPAFEATIGLLSFIGATAFVYLAFISDGQWIAARYLDLAPETLQPLATGLYIAVATVFTFRRWALDYRPRLADKLA